MEASEVPTRRSIPQHPLTQDAADRAYRFAIRRICLGLTILTALILILAFGLDAQKGILEIILSIPTVVPAFISKYIQQESVPILIVIIIMILVLFVVFWTTPQIIKFFWPNSATAAKNLFLPLADTTCVWLEHSEDRWGSQSAAMKHDPMVPKEGDGFFFERGPIRERLLNFANNGKAFDFLIVAGPSGIGKTRLAMNWVHILRSRSRNPLITAPRSWFPGFLLPKFKPRPWNAGFLPIDNVALLTRWTEDVFDWNPLRPTSIVVDTTKGIPVNVWTDFLDAMGRNTETLLYPVRILILTYQPPSTPLVIDGTAYTLDDDHLVTLSTLSVEGVRQVLSRGERAHQVSDAEAERVAKDTGGLPFLVRLLTSDDSRSAASLLCDTWARRILDEAGDTVFSDTPPLKLLRQVLAFSVLAGDVELASWPWTDRSLRALTGKAFIQCDQKKLYAPSPPLRGLAYLWCFVHDSISIEASPSGYNTVAPNNVASIVREAWARNPKAVAATIECYWLNVARNPIFSILGDKPQLTSDGSSSDFSDPAWFTTIDASPPKSDRAADAWWLESRLKIRNATGITANERGAIDEAIASAGGIFTPELAELIEDADVLRAIILVPEWERLAKAKVDGAWTHLLVASERFPANEFIRRGLLTAAPSEIERCLRSSQLDMVSTIEKAILDTPNEFLTSVVGRTYTANALAILLIYLSMERASERLQNAFAILCRIADEHKDEVELFVPFSAGLAAVADYSVTEYDGALAMASAEYLTDMCDIVIAAYREAETPFEISASAVRKRTRMRIYEIAAQQLAVGIGRIAVFQVRDPLEEREGDPDESHKEEASLPPDTETAVSGLKVLVWTSDGSQISGPERAARALVRLAAEFPKRRDVQMPLAELILERTKSGPLRLVSKEIPKILRFEPVLADIDERFPDDGAEVVPGNWTGS